MNIYTDLWYSRSTPVLSVCVCMFVHVCVLISVAHIIPLDVDTCNPAWGSGECLDTGHPMLIPTPHDPSIQIFLRIFAIRN